MLWSTYKIKRKSFGYQFHGKNDSKMIIAEWPRISCYISPSIFTNLENDPLLFLLSRQTANIKSFSTWKCISPRVEKHLESEASEELVLEEWALSPFPYHSLGESPSFSVKWKYHPIFCWPWWWLNVKIQLDGCTNCIWIGGFLVEQSLKSEFLSWERWDDFWL